MNAQRSTSGRRADRLVTELLSLSPAASRDLIEHDPRFHSLQIARLLTERSAAAQLERPEDAKRLATAALEVLDRLPSLQRTTTSLGPRAACLVGNACRLTRDLDRADSAYSSAASWFVDKEVTASFLRGLALLRWEQARCDEAVGLLVRAARCFTDAGLCPEAQTTLELLILLHAELDELKDAVALFNCLGPMDPSVRPWLSARAGLTAAFCLASLSDLAHLGQAALAALAQGSSLIPFVRDPNELLHLTWLEARARVRMGQDDEAEGTLVALRERFANTDVPLDYLLITLDLAAARMAKGQDAHALVEELKDLAAPMPEMTVATQAIESCLDLQNAEGSDPWRSASSLSSLLRRLFRSSLLTVAPLPFA